MNRFFKNSCVTTLILLMLGSLTALFTFAVFFQQSQAVAGNATATLLARTNTPVLPFAVRPTMRLTRTLPADEVTLLIQVEPTATPGILPSPLSPPDEPLANATSTSPVIPSAVAAPRHAGTSSYPLTVEAEAYLAQTNVARYQVGIAATRTAIAGESVLIFATLTAEARTIPTGVSP